MAEKFKFSDKRKKWIGKRTAVMKGSPLLPSAGISTAYYKKIMRLLDPMAKETAREISKILNSNAAGDFAQDASISSAFRIMFNKLARKYDRSFSQHAVGYALWLERQSKDHSKRMLGTSLHKLAGGITIKTDLMTGELDEKLKASVDKNTSLIKSIQKNYLDQVRSDVMHSITSADSGGMAGLREKIHNSLTTRYKQQRNKAKNVALDQSKKVFNTINAERMKAVGIKKFQWHHTGGSQRPRKDHIKMDGNIYSFDDLPVIDARTGERGIPGQAIHCNCFMTPVFEFEDGEEIT